jgi:hypothetical protein
MRIAAIFGIICGVLLALPAQAQQSEEQKKAERERIAKLAKAKAAAKEALKPRKDGLIPLNPQQSVLVDLKGKRVLLKTKVCNRDALLEMFVCLIERKTHESILVLDGEAIHLHTALKAIGAKEGAPAKFTPKYIQSHGQEIDIFVNWKDKDGTRQRCRAQDWIQHSVNRYHIEELKSLPATVKVRTKAALELRYDTRRKELLWFGPMTQEQRTQLHTLSEDEAYREAIDKLCESAKKRPMDAKFIFAGSFFYEDEDHPRFYTAEGGYVICVANLPEALIDVSIPSSGSNGALSFETLTEKIPPEGTEVTVELIPVPPKPEAKSSAKPKGEEDKPAPKTKENNNPLSAVHSNGTDASANQTPQIARRR